MGYVGGQFAVFNPIVFITALVILIRVKAKNSFECSLRWMISGMLLFFLVDSFRGRVEIHWTAPLSLPVLYLLITRWKEIPPAKSVLSGLYVFSALLLIARCALVFDFVPQLYKEFHRDKQKMAAIHQLAEELPVCFMNSYQNPSLYMFYTDGKAHAINNIEGGKNQYDYWNYNEYIHKKPFLFVASYDASGFGKDTLGRFVFDTKKYDDLPVLHGVKIRTDEWLHHYHAGDTARIAASIVNANRYEVQLKNDSHQIRWKAMFNHKKRNEANPDLHVVGLPDALAPGETARIELQFVIPDIREKNYLLFATQVDELPHTYQSNKLRVMID